MRNKKDPTWLALSEGLEKAMKALDGATHTINNNINPKLKVSYNKKAGKNAEAELEAQNNHLEKIIVNTAQPAIKAIHTLVPQVERYCLTPKGVTTAVEAAALVKRTKTSTGNFQSACNTFKANCAELIEHFDIKSMSAGGANKKDKEALATMRREHALQQKKKVRPVRILLLIVAFGAVMFRMSSRFGLLSKWGLDKYIGTSNGGDASKAQPPSDEGSP